MTIWQHGIKATWHRGNEAQRQYGIKATWHKGNIAQRQYGIDAVGSKAVGSKFL